MDTTQEYVNSTSPLHRLNKAHDVTTENLHVRAENKARYDDRATQHKFYTRHTVYYKMALY